MRMTEQELEAYIRQYTELEKECMKSRFPEKFSNEEFCTTPKKIWNV